MYDYARPYVTMYDYVSHLTLFGPVWPCVAVFDPFAPIWSRMTHFDHILHCFAPKNDDKPIIKDNSWKEDNPKKVKHPKNGDSTKNNDDPKNEDEMKNKDHSKNAEGPKKLTQPKSQPKNWRLHKNKDLPLLLQHMQLFPLTTPAWMTLDRQWCS